MTTRLRTIAAGVAWIMLSPFAVLMVLMANEKSLPVFYAHLLGWGIWSAGGVVAGVGTLASARWAGRFKAILSWAAFGYFATGAVLLIGYVVVFARQKPGLLIGLPVAAMVLATSLPFLMLAKRQSRAR
jgi:hypothetical protein